MSVHPSAPLSSASPSRSDEITATLRTEILSGQYRAGERLPSERDLALRFHTGRGPVREALKRLEQLGIASIQHGGARAVAIEDSTLDVLGPLLDLDALPDPRLIDQVLEIFGVLVHVAASAAIHHATDEQMLEIRRHATSLLDDDADELARHTALRDFTRYLVKVADHLVLTLIMNGLVTNCLRRLTERGIEIDLDNAAYRRIATELCCAVDERDHERVGSAMQKLNRFFRDSVAVALAARKDARKSSHA
ncbi:MAG: GntR family transcriptional regulator [Gammaproteobacteria bacterium]|jgi:DNA-binding FadR family transcriptional regulator